MMPQPRLCLSESHGCPHLCLSRFRVLRGQRQGEHQCKAGLRAPSGYHLREDERVPGTQLQPWKQWEKPDLGRCPTLPVQWLQLLGMVPNPCPPPPTSAWTVTEAWATRTVSKPRVTPSPLPARITSDFEPQCYFFLFFLDTIYGIMTAS